ncbi:NAD(P)-binding domain-containing protein [Deinococcus multiflagellatus]|uniref:NAD(P)-binding domain-containing protein n=1 Tax=Deinococcus multiflagellatus TaxID=1656887 RepID=A0ABW1ZTI8_9DEIO
MLHSLAYQEPSPFVGQRVLVVGAGNSAVQIAVELTEVARVTLANRTRVQFTPQRPLGRDVHDWITWARVDQLTLGHLRRLPSPGMSSIQVSTVPPSAGENWTSGGCSRASRPVVSCGRMVRKSGWMQ